MCKLTPIQTTDVESVWPEASRSLARAIIYDDFNTIDDVLLKIKSEQSQLFLCNETWIVTRINKTIAGLKLTVWLVSGEITPQECFESVLFKLEQYAKYLGCVAVNVNGRQGWAKKLKQYKIKSITLERRL